MEIDNPLKQHIADFSQVFAEWLLGHLPQAVTTLNIELPASATRMDLAFRVVEANERTTLLHIELQGPGTREPMSWRMVDYMTRLVRRELGNRPLDTSVRLQSVVIYVQGAGANDTGQYEILGVDGLPSLTWRYKPIRLWQVEDEALLALKQPALLALAALTRLRKPEQTLPEVIARIQQVEDEGQQGRLLATLTSLIDDEEILKMAEKILDPLDEFLLELPYQKRIRQQGMAQGLAEGEQKGVLVGLRKALLKTIALRFNPAILEYERISQQLERVSSEAVLERLHTVAIQAEEIAIFTARLAEELSDSTIEVEKHSNEDSGSGDGGEDG